MRFEIRFLIVAITLTLSLAVFGCSSSSDDNNNIDGDNTSDGDKSPDGDTTSDGDQDATDGDVISDGDEDESVDGDEESDGDAEILPCENGGYRLIRVSGRILDQDNNPLSGGVVLCVRAPGGIDTCLNPSLTDEAGEYTVQVPLEKQCVEWSAIQYLSANTGYTPMYCPIPLERETSVLTLGDTKLVQMPNPSEMDTLGDTQAIHSVTASDGSVLSVIPDDILSYEGDYEDLKILVWDSTKWGWPCFVDENAPPHKLIAIIPEAEIDTENGAYISFPNDLSLTSGTELDLYALGALATKTFDGEELTEGDWDKIGSITATQDESALSSTPIPFFTWLGYYSP